jgi:type IX secretion system PorP/SprF family membrane protein
MKYLIPIFFFILPFDSKGQDIHFTQTPMVPQLINPATAGVFEGWERITLSNRKQWYGIQNSYFTSQFSFDFNLLKNDNGPDKSYLGLGLSFYNDIAGDGKFGINQLNISIAGVIPIAENQTVSAAIQVGGAQRSGNIENLMWGNQFNGTEFDMQLASNESNSISSYFHEDIGAGIFYNFRGSKSKLVRNEISNFYIGAAYFHITSPKLWYRNGTSERLNSKIILHGGAEFDVPDTEWSTAGSFVFMDQGPHQQTMLNLMVKARMKNGTKYTGVFNESYFGFGIIHRFKDALAPQLLFEFGSYKIGILYELTVSNLSSAARGGFEVSFQWANMRNALFTSRRSKGHKRQKL